VSGVGACPQEAGVLDFDPFGDLALKLGLASLGEHTLSGHPRDKPGAGYAAAMQALLTASRASPTLI